MDWVKRNPEFIGIFLVGMLFLSVVVFGVVIPIIRSNRIDKINSQLCLDNGYLGYDTVNLEPVCYGYVEKNQLVVVQIESLR